MQLTNQPKGNYGIRLLNLLGQVILSKQILNTNGGNEVLKLDNNIAQGLYKLEVTKPDKEVVIINIIN